LSIAWFGTALTSRDAEAKMKRSSKAHALVSPAYLTVMSKRVVLSRLLLSSGDETWFRFKEVNGSRHPE
jgi:hypothetical protein